MSNSCVNTLKVRGDIATFKAYYDEHVFTYEDYLGVPENYSNDAYRKQWGVKFDAECVKITPVSETEIHVEFWSNPKRELLVEMSKKFPGCDFDYSFIVLDGGEPGPENSGGGLYRDGILLKNYDAQFYSEEAKDAIAGDDPEWYAHEVIQGEMAD